jgi:hypothetical protein
VETHKSKAAKARPILDMSDADNVRRWCREFNVDENEIASAVRFVGTRIHRVRAYLRAKAHQDRF